MRKESPNQPKPEPPAKPSKAAAALQVRVAEIRRKQLRNNETRDK